MIRRCLLLPSLALLLALQACAVWPPGEDPAGRARIATANQVLFALQAFHAAEGRLPGELDELAPKYIAALPTKPGVWFDRKSGQLSFHYAPTLSWGQCMCVASISSTSFGCGLCYI